MTKIRIFRKVNSGSDPTLDSGQPYIDATVTPGRLYIGQGNGSLANSEIAVSKADDADYATNASYATNAGVATQLSTERSIITNLGSNTAAAFDGTKDIEAGVEGVLGVSNGGTGNEDGVVAKAGFATEAESLTDYMTFITQLNSESEGQIKEGGKYCGIGVTGILPVSHGGTGTASFPISSNNGSGEDVSGYCGTSALSYAGVVDSNYQDRGATESAIGYYNIIGKFVIMNVEWVGKLEADWGLRIDVGGWLSDVGYTLSTIIGMEAHQRMAPDCTLDGVTHENNCSIYYGANTGYVYIGQDYHDNSDGYYMTAYGILK